RAAARLMVRQIGARARIVGLLRFPGDDAALDINLPRAGTGTIHAMRGTHDLVVLPALAIAILPAAVFVRGDAVSFGKGFRRPLEEGQSVQKVTHFMLLIRKLAVLTPASGSRVRGTPTSRWKPR